MSNFLNEFIKISKFAGERFDLVQAGGGNSSVKFSEDKMYIKASGYSLSEVSNNKAYSIVSTSMVRDILKNKDLLASNDKFSRQKICSSLLSDATLHEHKPSIETLLHSLMLRYSLHTHPLLLNVVLVQSNWKSALKDLFKDYQVAFVNYHTPGIELALALYDTLENSVEIPKIIFLQNHGLIVHSNDMNEVLKLTDTVCSKLEGFLHIDHSRYRLCNRLSQLLSQVSQKDDICYLSEDRVLYNSLQKSPKLFHSTPFCPDSLVYCGYLPLHLKDINKLQELEKYISRYQHLPKVIIYDSSIFFVAPTLDKAKQMEEVLKFHISVLANCKGDVNFLDQEEICYLNDWDAEKFRQNLQK